jgi:hypothetical protein
MENQSDSTMAYRIPLYADALQDYFLSGLQKQDTCHSISHKSLDHDIYNLFVQQLLSGPHVLM